MIKKINSLEIREEIEKVRNIGESENVKINLVDPTQKTVNLGVNWSSLGTVSVEEAQKFIDELQKTVDLVKQFEYQGYEKI